MKNTVTIVVWVNTDGSIQVNNHRDINSAIIQRNTLRKNGYKAEACEVKPFDIKKGRIANQTLFA